MNLRVLPFLDRVLFPCLFELEALLPEAMLSKTSGCFR